MKRPASFWDRLAGVDPRVGDGLLAFALLALEVAAAGGPGGPDRGDDLVPALLLLAMTVPLVWRRRAPLVVLTIVAGAVIVAAPLGFSSIVALSLSVVAYTAAAYRRADLGLVLGLTGAAVGSAALTLASPSGFVATIAGVVLRVGLPAALGLVIADRRRWIERNTALAAERAAGAERALIARELHDIVVHAMGVMVVQAGAARAVLRSAPDHVEPALRRIEDTGRSGLAEMRRLLDTDREDVGDGAPRTPQAGLDHIDDLVDDLRGAGLAVQVTVEGEPFRLPPGADLSAYRIVQEALSNTLRHAGATTAEVRLAYAPDALVIEVLDDGAVAGTTPDLGTGGGRGLAGMRERVALFGGVLSTGPRSGGGYAVRARLPLRDAT